MSDGDSYLRAPTAPPQDLEAERSVLGAALLRNDVLDTLTVELRLDAKHFYRISNGHIYSAMLAIVGRGEGVDPETLWYELHQRGQGEIVGGKAAIEALAGGVPAVANYRQYAQRVIRMAEWRSRLESVYEQLQAIASMDEAAFSDALLTDQLADAGHDGLLTPEMLALQWTTWYDADTSDAITTPWPKIDSALFGGFRPGDTTVLAGWSGMGKSVVGDQLLEHAKAKHELLGCVYLNEMSHIDRVSRLLAARSGASFGRIMRKQLTPVEIGRALKEAPRLPFAMQPCAGWSADAICRHIRRHRWGVAFIDLATRIPARKTADWDYISGAIADAARQSGTHVILAVQLNRERATTALRPMPVLRDLRNTGAWETDARNVLFVHRTEELDKDTGLPVIHDDGVLHLAKVSNGRPDAERVFLDYARMRFSVLVGDPTERESSW